MKKEGILRKLGENIRHYRNAIGISQEELGFRTELHRTYIGSVERGERNIGILNLVKIATALHVSPVALIESIPLGNHAGDEKNAP
ncbi:MAG: helix-turn-helix transcriptional regulator [Anaerolineae bacterium]|nr:helix-turn-helix transcriptional regulator [Anaerolineae bacterium]